MSKIADRLAALGRSHASIDPRASMDDRLITRFSHEVIETAERLMRQPHVPVNQRNALDQIVTEVHVDIKPIQDADL
jgi:hypothetical protein